MKQYIVKNSETGYHEEFFKLSSAKKAMSENNAKGYIFKYTKDEIIPCGEITLKGSNKTFIANTKQTTKSYK